MNQNEVKGYLIRENTVAEEMKENTPLYSLCNFIHTAKSSSTFASLLVHPMTPFILFLCLAICSYLYMSVTRTARMVNKFPGGPLLPFIGTAYMFLGKPQDMVPMLKKYTQRYGGCFRFWKLQFPFVALVEPQHVEKVLSSSKHIDKGKDYEHLHWMNGEGLITSGGQVWKEDRKMLNPAFRNQQRFLNSFNKHSQILIEILTNMFSTGTEVKELHPVLCRCTMDTVFEGVLGQSFNIQKSSSDDETSETLYDSAKLLMKSYRLRTLKPWLVEIPFVWKLIGMVQIEIDIKRNFSTAMMKVIDERKKMLENGLIKDNEETKAFIDVLLESKTNTNIVDHAFTIFAAGFETNARATEVALFMLALHPEYQAKVHEELDRVFEGNLERDVDFGDLGNLTYLEMCIKESMRLYPPAPLLSRTLHSDLELDNGMTIPKGCDVAIFVYQLHRDPKSFPNPEAYNPERFLPSNCSERHPFAYIPFSKGPRSCIGQRYAMLQMKLVISYILRKFSVSTKMKRNDAKYIHGVVMELDKNLDITLTKRK